MPPLLGDIVRETLAAHRDVIVAAEVSARDEIGPAVRRTDADVAIVGVAPRDWKSLNELLRELFTEQPRLAVIALANDGRNGCVYRMQPSTVALADISPQSLVETIRATSTMDVHPVIHPFSAD